MYLLAFLDLITSLLNPQELDLYFKNTKFFYFNIKNYKFIRKTYSRY